MFATRGLGLDLTEGVDARSQTDAVLAMTGLQRDDVLKVILLFQLLIIIFFFFFFFSIQNRF